jgi:flavin reductase (DIM6/NTAB) family NADH-FMN oxidoreductase RutF
MLSLAVNSLSPTELQQHLQYLIAPRPICFASTIDAHGNVNLSPFSFFNLFSSNPPTCVFSPSRRVRDNTTKHSLENVLEVPECVINIVDYSMVHQMSLASTEYPKGIDEFKKSGFTPEPSVKVKPPRVKEAPAQLECIVKEVKPLGDGPGAGNLVIAEIVHIHIQDRILNSEGKIDQAKVDLVARLGGSWYCRVQQQNLFTLPKPLTSIGVGIDALPDKIKFSKVLTGNHLGMIGNVDKIPEGEEILKESAFEHVSEEKAHIHTAKLCDEGKPDQALQYIYSYYAWKG